MTARATAGFTLRAPRADEAAAIAELINASGRAHYGVDTIAVDEIARWFTSPKSDPERDFRLAELSDRTLAGFGSVADVSDDHGIMWLRVTLHPEHGTQETGEELMAAADERARERGVAGHSLVHASCSSKDERVIGIYERHGYRLVRHFLRMEIDLARPTAEPVWPEGIELRPLDIERDLERVFEADEEAFLDHWGFVRIPFDAWKHWMIEGEDFDPTLWLLAYDGDELAGFSLNFSEEGGDPDIGWIGVLGVRRPWRRRGLALALLLESFAEFRRRGRKRAGLGVDAENLTGAVRLYEKAGMSPTRRYDTFEKAL
jgi:mycothiol synthase